MSLFELFILAVGLSMDAFAVSVCKGLSADHLRPVHNLTCGLYFGGFQAMMPLLGLAARHPVPGLHLHSGPLDRLSPFVHHRYQHGAGVP